MRKNIEWITKECNTCGSEYEWSMYNKKGLCLRCRQELYNARHRMSEDQKKKPYPLAEKEKRQRYSRIKEELRKTYCREEWQKIFNRELDYIFESGIFLWLTDWRPASKKAVSPDRKGIKGRKPIHTTDPKIKLPDTRHMHE